MNSHGLRLTPLAMCLLLAGLAFFLMAVNDGNNLLYLLSFLPLSLIISGTWQCWRDQAHTTIHLHAPAACFAGETRVWQLATMPIRRATLEGMLIQSINNNSYTDIPNNRTTRAWPSVTVLLHDALGLCYWKKPITPAGTEIVWPRPCGEQAPPSPASRGHSQQLESPQDWRLWRNGDNLRRVLWRAYARHGQLLLPQDENASALHLRLSDANAPDLEAQLSQLSAWICAAAQHSLDLDDGEPMSQQRSVSLNRLARFSRSA